MNSSLSSFLAHAYTREEARRALAQAGFGAGATAIVHASLFQLGHMVDDNGDLAQTWIDLLLEAVSPDGVIILPAFTYSYCKGEVFDPHKSLSTVNALANYAIATHQGYRSLDPIFSYVLLPASERQAERIARYQFSNVCFDMSHSVLGLAQELCAEHSTPIIAELLADTAQRHWTLVHHIEQKNLNVTRFMKRFSGTTIIDGKATPSECYFFCRLMAPNTISTAPMCSQGMPKRLIPLGHGFILATAIDECLAYYDQYKDEPWRFKQGPVLSESELQELRSHEEVVDPATIARVYSTPVKL